MSNTQNFQNAIFYNRQIKLVTVLRKHLFVTSKDFCTAISEDKVSKGLTGVKVKGMTQD